MPEQPQPPPEFIVPTEVLLGKYANGVHIVQMRKPTAGDEVHTRGVVLNFFAHYPEGPVVTARIAMDREDFAEILRFMVKESGEGGQFANFL